MHIKHRYEDKLNASLQLSSSATTSIAAERIRFEKSSSQKSTIEDHKEENKNK